MLAVELDFSIKTDRLGCIADKSSADEVFETGDRERRDDRYELKLAVDVGDSEL